MKGSLKEQRSQCVKGENPFLYNTLNFSQIKDSNSTGQYLLLYRNSYLVPRTLQSLSANDSWHQKKSLV